MRLLVIEDDENIARSMQKGLREEGFAVDVAAFWQQTGARTKPTGQDG